MRVEIVPYEAPGWGVGEVWLDGDRVVNHELPVPGRALRRRTAHSQRRRAGPGPRLQERVLAYFRGEEEDFGDIELELDWCTPFQRAVIDALRAVPYGETVTYGELAALAGYPNAHRAAGTVCAGNRFPLIVPCHRVVAASGLGAFGSLGDRYKHRLLRLEAAPRGHGAGRWEPDQ